MASELALGDSYYATPDIEGCYRSGELFHIERNDQGGTWSTPIAYYFAWRPDIGPEGHHPHWRLDCFVRRHALAPDPEWLTRLLAEALLANHAVSEPLWFEWHRTEELDGDRRGEVFEID